MSAGDGNDRRGRVKGSRVMELFAVYLESLDQNLVVFEKEENAHKYFDELKAEGKPVKVQKFGDWQLAQFEKATWASTDDPEYFEELKYNNGRYVLIVRYCWHQPPEKEGYYADYEIVPL